MARGVVLVTGGSRGIGRATSLLAGKIGYTVAVNFRRRQKLADRLVATIKRRGGKAYAIKADVASEDGVKQLFRDIDARGGRLVGLVNNAGDSEDRVSALEISAERAQRIFAVNFLGTLLCAQEAARRMKRGKRGGVIVNVSSISAHSGGAKYHVDYAAMKAGIESLTRGLAREFAASDIRVNAVCPGSTATAMSASLKGTERRHVIKRIPIRRFARPEEIARGILWLLSNEASYVTGAVLDIAGGK
jgi:NAD(P)-dependent dehydrogenase (short-subunit alcohol dehydrogenase family)